MTFSQEMSTVDHHKLSSKDSITRKHTTFSFFFSLKSSKDSPAAASLPGCVSLFMVHLSVFGFWVFFTIYTGKKIIYYLKDFRFLYFSIQLDFPPLAVPPENLSPCVRTYMHIYSSRVRRFIRLTQTYMIINCFPSHCCVFSKPAGSKLSVWWSEISTQTSLNSNDLEKPDADGSSQSGSSDTGQKSDWNNTPNASQDTMISCSEWKDKLLMSLTTLGTNKHHNVQHVLEDPSFWGKIPASAHVPKGVHLECTFMAYSWRWSSEMGHNLWLYCPASILPI